VVKGIKPFLNSQVSFLPSKRLLLVLSALFLIPMDLLAWINGELLDLAG
jgi:hypothetical protein